jgi:hypothetical protein
MGKRFVWALTFSLPLFGGGALAQEPAPLQAAPNGLLGREHRLVVTTNPETYITAERVDEIVQKMNDLIAHADPRCSGAYFVRSGAIIYDRNLALGGFADDLEKNLVANEPKANVFVVTGIEDCAGVQAAGCTPLGPARAMAVIDETERNGVVWVHERGHAVGLGHWKQGQPDSAMAPDDLSNIMYKQALQDAHLLQPTQCDHYRTASNAASVFAVASVATVTDPPPPNRQPAPLTPKAQKILSLPWQHGMPIDQAKDLDHDDLASMSKALRETPPTPDWPKILTLLAYNNSSDYMSAAQFVLNHEQIKIPATDLATPQSAEFEAKASEARALSSAKQAVPIASGIYGYVSGDIQAAFQLSSLASPENASRYVGNNLAQTVSKSASAGLAIASANASNSTRNQNIAALTQGLFQVENDRTTSVLANVDYAYTNRFDEETGRQAARAYHLKVNVEQANFINMVYARVKEGGLDNFLQNGLK